MIFSGNFVPGEGVLPSGVDLWNCTALVQTFLAVRELNFYSDPPIRWVSCIVLSISVGVLRSSSISGGIIGRRIPAQVGIIEVARVILRLLTSPLVLEMAAFRG
jgi:hypothetical protein